MLDMNGLNFGMGTIPLITSAKSRSICAENPNGDVGGGAKVENHLGAGWKGRPCIELPRGETTVLADIDGPGVINHIWITHTTTSDEFNKETGHRKRRATVYRDLVLRMYWDGEKGPSVEVPIGDFFCNGHAERCNIVSLPINVNPSGGFNSYWPMPFAKKAKITVENQCHAGIAGFFYQIDYSLTDIPENAGRFHAQWRREDTTEYLKEYTILDGVKGKGHYAGTYMAWTQLLDGWWGEGEIKFYIDGDDKHPTICGTGTEDYFGGAWGFGDETFNAPFLGYPYMLNEPEKLVKHGLYRWHIMDPIRFAKDLKVTMQALGWSKDGKLYPLRDDIASVAYWYQREPHTVFPKLLDPPQRWPR